MPTAAEYTSWIRLLEWEGVELLWGSVLMGSTPGWEPGKALEYLILRAFELSGAQVRWPYSMSLRGQVIGQIDGAVYAANLACLVEAKDTTEPVRPDAVGKLRQQVARRPAGVMGLLFSRSGFSEAATTLAQFLAPRNVLLWTGADLSVAIDQRDIVGALEAKYRFCVEKGSPRYDLQLEGAR